MEQHSNELDRCAEVSRTPLAKAVSAAVGTAAKDGPAPTFIPLDCSLCRNSFVIDMREEWDCPPEEIEVKGREFLGIRQDSVLCPRCLHSVEVTGAERVYWRLAHC